MKTSVIRHRVADFLKSYAPFDSLPEADLLELAGSGRVKFHQSEEYVFWQDGQALPFVWIVQQGRVELLDERPGREQLTDVLGAGEILGLDRFHGAGRYRAAARTASDVILYALDAALFQALAERHPTVRSFLAAHFSALAGAKQEQLSWLDAGLPPLEFLQARTERNRQALGAAPRAIKQGGGTREAVRAMLEARVEALALEDTVLTAADLALFCHRNPARLQREILEARSSEELDPLYAQGASLVLDGLNHPADVNDCAFIGTELLAALAEACIGLAHRNAIAAGLQPPNVPCCWLAFGALARGEILRPELPQIAVVYDDADPDCGASSGTWFGTLAANTLAWMKRCGLAGGEAAWPVGTHSSMPISEWMRFYQETIHRPLEHNLYGRREFFDVRALTGDTSLLMQLRGHIAAEMAKPNALAMLLANDSLSHQPPLTFYQGAVVALDGAERKDFDLAEAAIHPILDAARAFALGKRGIECTNTLQRLEQAGLDHPGNEQVFVEAAEAFRTALYHQARTGSSLLDPSTLSSYDRRVFKTAFASVQRLLEVTA